MSEKSQTDILRDLCGDHIGDHYESDDWKRAADTEDWADHWPIVDGDGCLTGGVFNGEGDCGNVGDSAMVDISDLDEAQQKEIRREQDDGTWEGYVAVKAARTE